MLRRSEGGLHTARNNRLRRPRWTMSATGGRLSMDVLRHPVRRRRTRWHLTLPFQRRILVNVGFSLRRAAALLAALALAQGTLGQCVGWQATPEARRQCCQTGACARHERVDVASQQQISQAAADDCCAQAQRGDSRPSGKAFASTITFAVLSALPAVALAPAPGAAITAPWRALSTPPHVPRHLLLSVLLV
jgi:hypothetical protein